MRRWFALALALTPILARASDDFDFFEKKIRPVLVERCYACHSASARTLSGGLMLDSAPGMKRGGDSGKPAVTAGDLEKSRLIPAIRRDGKLKMPPGDPLTAAQISDFEEWIKMGAPDPRVKDFKAPSPYHFEEAKKFWSVQPVKDPAPPKIADASLNKDWNKTAIDRFVKAKLDEKNLKPMGIASKRTLIRRATYDLTGLPPTPEQVAAFMADTSPGAFDKVIDRLLASPQYGERWGRHWLDVVRYADTCGDNSDFPLPEAYRYRNWVIRAFNDDKPYDQFLREQIAGDLLVPAKEISKDAAGKDAAGKDVAEDRRDKIIATGYLAISRRFGSGMEEFHLTIDDTIDNVGKSMLGLSVACARCHDHKFDPIPQRDYYALYGIFESSKYTFPGTELYPYPKDYVALNPKDAPKLKAVTEEMALIERQVHDLDGAAGKDLTPEEKGKRFQAAADRIAVLERDFPKGAAKVYAVTEGTPADARIQRKGDPHDRGAIVPRGFLQILGGQTLPPEEKGSGRRELADWITDPTNPLTARVMVNRIWQGHFGKGIVGTPDDFGVRGDRPVNPELLDWLASRFRESGYSAKAMHRLIMRTRAYQMAVGDDPLDARIAAKDTELDPKNEFGWRFDRRRLDAEEIRDSMLAAAGDLDPAMGGPHPFPPEFSRFSQHDQFFAVYDNRQRSVYLMQQRLKKHPFLEAFDGADPNASTPVRTPQETSLQALTLLNSAFVDEQADLLAVRVGLAYVTPFSRITYAYRLAFGRAPSLTEIRDCEQYLEQARAAFRDSGLAADRQPRAALASLMHVLLASNEFLFVD